MVTSFTPLLPSWDGLPKRETFRQSCLTHASKHASQLQPQTQATTAGSAPEEALQVLGTDVAQGIGLGAKSGLQLVPLPQVLHPLLEFNAKKPSKVKAVDPDANYSVEGTDGGSFAIASTKKELKQLMRSVRRSSTTRPKASSSSMRTAPQKAGEPRRWVA